MDRHRPDAEKGTKVFCGNIPPDTESSDLRDFFRDYGVINDAWVARKPPGFGFVFFDSERDAKDAVRDLNGREMRGNRVRIELSKPRGASPRRSYGSSSGSRGDSRDERSPPRRSGGGTWRNRSKSPSPRGGGGGRSPRGGSGGGRSPRARSPFQDRDKRDSGRDSKRDRPERSRSPRRSAPEEDTAAAPAAAKKAENGSPPPRRRSRSRSKERNRKESRERSRS